MPRRNNSRSKISTSSNPKQRNITAAHIRRDLAMAITILLIIVAMIAAFQIGAMPVLDKVLPLAAIIFGFFFGHKANNP